MRKILILALLGPAVAWAQGAAPQVSVPSHLGQTQALATIGLPLSSAIASAVALPQAPGPVPDKADPPPAPDAAPTASVSLSAGTPYLQQVTVQPLPARIGASFEGLGQGTPGFDVLFAPSDANIAVSATQVVQVVNTQLAVYDKAGNPLLPASGFISVNLLWRSLPVTSRCRQFNGGSPLVRYDAMARRWIVTQPVFDANVTQSAQCFAVSTTDNALGTYHLYEYSFGDRAAINARLGVWPDAYYMSYRLFAFGLSFSEDRACAYDRAAMLAGLPATQVCFSNPRIVNYLPADMDGTRLPPAGTPNVFVSSDLVLANPPYTLQLTKFRPDFVNPAQSTFDDGFGGPPLSFVGIALPGTLDPCNDFGGNCVQQPGTTNLLDSGGQGQNYRLAYRNFGTHDALLLTQPVDPDGSGPRRAALRWMEIRNPAASPPVVFQNSTFDVDGTSRWVGTATFDKLGNIGIGYSASSSTVSPGIRISGRLRGDPRNLLRTEVQVQAGGGSQTFDLHRWGDHTSMQIDPADDCTFWTTGQYLTTSGAFNWHTRIVSFRFPNCQ